MSSGRRPVVGVMGSGTDEHPSWAEPLGRWIATRGYHLLTGGGCGVMTSVSRGFCSVTPRAGLCLGVIPGEVDAHGHHPREGYPHPHVELALHTHLPLSGAQGMEPMSRNHINVLSSDVIVALPGGLGTASEVALARRYAKPLVVYLPGTTSVPWNTTGMLVLDALADVTSWVEATLAAARR
ncbi:MAG: molybdenum cofactor carrier protein [Myxococcota bacterium]